MNAPEKPAIIIAMEREIAELKDRIAILEKIIEAYFGDG